MEITVNRLQYDAEGSETTALGLPATLKTETHEGGVEVGGVSVDEAFDVEELNVSDDHSTGLVALAAKIAEVQSQKRCIPTDIAMPTIKGYPIDEDDKTDWDGVETEDTLEEVIPATAIAVGGVPVKKVWRSSGEVSYLVPSGSVVMDDRKSMAGYSIAGGADVVWKILPKEYATEEIMALLGVDSIAEGVSVDAESGQFDAACEITAKSNYMLGVFSRLNIDKLLGIAAIKIGIGGGVAEWMITAHVTYGIAYANLAKAFSMLPEMQWCFKEGKDCVLKASGNGELIVGTESFNTATDDLEIAFSFADNTNSYTTISMYDSSSICIAVQQYDATHLCVCSGKYSWSQDAVVDFTKKIKVNFKAGQSAIVNDTTTNKYAAKTIGHYDLVGTYQNGTEVSTSRIISYYPTIHYRSGSLIHYYVPSKQDGAYGMFDLVEGKFYANQGTGSFSIEVIDD